MENFNLVLFLEGLKAANVAIDGKDSAVDYLAHSPQRFDHAVLDLCGKGRDLGVRFLAKKSQIDQGLLVTALSTIGFSQEQAYTFITNITWIAE